ncbi:MAG: GumC family protein, partial [Armatimonadota bacterium]
MRFWHFYRIILRRKWLVLGLTGVTMLAILISTANDKPYYRAAVHIMPSDAALSRPILPSSGASVIGDVGHRLTDNQLPNLMSILKSRPVAERTIRLAGLKEDPDSLLARVAVSTSENPGARSRDELDTDIILVQVGDGKPKQAIRIANTMAHVFSSFYQEISHQEAAENRRFLEQELVRAENDMESASRRLKEFKAGNTAASSPDASQAAVAAFSSARANYDAARASLAEAQARLSQVERQLRRTGPTRTIVEGTSNTPMVQQLDAQLADLTKQLNDARSRYEDNHPRVVALRGNIAEVQQRLKAEQGKMQRTSSQVRNELYDNLLAERARLAAERDGFAARVSQLSAAVQRTSADVRPEKGVTLARLESEFTAAGTAYDNLKAQLNQARISEKETTNTGAIRVIDEATAAEGPIGTNRALYLILGALLSLVFGSGLAITIDSLDNRIKSHVDVEQLLGLPVTALIPKAIGPGGSGLARIAYTDPVSPISEAYRFLRTDLLLASQVTGAKTIMVATAKPGQCGTNTVANLAISLAQDGKRVVVVDADMRRPSLHRIFKAENGI